MIHQRGIVLSMPHVEGVYSLVLMLVYLSAVSTYKYTQLLLPSPAYCHAFWKASARARFILLYSFCIQAICETHMNPRVVHSRQNCDSL
jgi:hypothetical protein